MDFETLKVTIEDGIATVRINRPECFNAINDKVLIETALCNKMLEEDDEVKAIVLAGNEENKFFAAGADIRELVDYAPVQTEKFIALVHTAIKGIYNATKPTVAAIAGLALGGGLEMTLACDMRIAADTALFGVPEINLGVLPGGGGTQQLPRIIGIARAKQMIYSGEMIDAQTALSYGLVNKVVPVAELREESLRMARKLTRKPPVAFRMAKSLINTALDVNLDDGLIAEKNAFSLLFSTADQKEGMKAFMENRRATFVGK
ncbi:MAG: enoyl-CoA hydratase/isomerase family protein [Chitinophagales bacterium]